MQERTRYPRLYNTLKLSDDFARYHRAQAEYETITQSAVSFTVTTAIRKEPGMRLPILFLLVLLAGCTGLSICVNVDTPRPQASVTQTASKTPDTIYSQNITNSTTPITGSLVNETFFTRFNCTHPQSRRLTFTQENPTDIQIVLDAVPHTIDNIQSLAFSMAPDSTVYLIDSNGQTRFPIPVEPIGYCQDTGTPDAPLSRQPELIVSALTAGIGCTILSAEIETIIGYVITNLGGLDSGTFQVKIQRGWYNTVNEERLYEEQSMPARSSRIVLFDPIEHDQIERTMITVEVDSDNRVFELREDNNIISHTRGCVPLT